MYPQMGDGGSGWWVVMMIGMLLFWAAVFVGLYLLYRVLAHRGIFSPSSETPRAILDRRLAAGEISQDDYVAVRRTLEGGV
jgi:uncharacterized membrane protein